MGTEETSLRVVFTGRFLKEAAAHDLDEEFLQVLTEEILARNKTHPVIVNAAAARKCRVARPGAGKSGGFRVCYFLFRAYGVAVCFEIFAKNEKENVSAREKQIFIDLRKAIETELKKGRI